MSEVADSRRSFVSSEIRAVAEKLRVRAQEARGDRMERPSRRAIQVGADERLDAALHLARGTVREREEKQRRGVGAVFDEARDAVGQRPCFPASGAGDDEQWPLAGHDHLELLGIELVLVAYAVVLLRFDRLLERVTADLLGHGMSVAEGGPKS